jgi:YtcA family
VIGIFLTVGVRLFFVRIKLEDELLFPLILVYPCLTALFTFTLWLVFYS